MDLLKRHFRETFHGLDRKVYGIMTSFQNRELAVCASDANKKKYIYAHTHVRAHIIIIKKKNGSDLKLSVV